MRHLSAAIVTVILASVVLSAAGQGLTGSVPATPENAAAFLGDWTINANGSYGPVTMAVSVKTAAGKVVVELTDQNGKRAISDVTKSGTSLILGYAFDYQGQAIDAVVTLTPKDQGVDAFLDFAGGAAQFTGTATKR